MDFGGGVFMLIDALGSVERERRRDLLNDSAVWVRALAASQNTGWHGAPQNTGLQRSDSAVQCGV